MAADAAAKLETDNPCCKAWKEKYSKLEKKRCALRQAVDILTPQIDTLQAENVNLKKGYEEEQARADNEKEGRLKESTYRVSLENELSVLKSEIALLQKKPSTNAVDRDQEVRLLQDCVSERENEINRLKELLEKEKKKADVERKNAEGEKKKAAELRKSLKVEKSKSDEERRMAKIGGEKVEQYKLQLEILKKEADDAKSKLAAETLKFDQANKRLEEERRKAIKERKRTDCETARAEEEKKLAEANRKKAVEEKGHAENLFRQLEEKGQRAKELQEIREFLYSRKVAFPGIQVDNKSNPESVLELLKESDKVFEIEKQKVIRLKTLADSEMAKAAEQKSLVEVYFKKAMEEKCRADQLSKQLLEDKRLIEELRKKIDELLPSRKLLEGSAVAPVKAITSGNANVKLLKKQLKFEKTQVKHAKQVAKFEKTRNRILQLELGRLKLEFDQFANRLDMLSKSFSPSAEGINDLGKTGRMARTQRLGKRKKLCSLEPSQVHLQSDNEFPAPSCIDMDASDSLGQNLQHLVPLLPIYAGNLGESISGTNSKLESPLGCSNRKMLQTSAINSSTASFSDRQLMGSQEKCAFCVSTSSKLVEENLNAQAEISNLSGEVTKLRCREKSAEVAENNVKNHACDGVGRSEHLRKRKQLLDYVESMEYLYSKGKKLHTQIEDKLSFFHGMVDKQVGNPLKEGTCLTPNLQCVPHAKLAGLHKNSKLNHEKVLAKQFFVSDKWKKMESVETEVLEDASDVETVGSFEDVADGDYMKLLDLDNGADEQRFRMAMEIPVSPTLPSVDLHDVQILDVENSEALVEDQVYKKLATDEENLLPTCSFEVIDVEIDSNQLKLNVLGPSNSLSPHKNVGCHDSSAVNGNGFCSTVKAGKDSPQQNSGLDVGMSSLPISRDEEVKIPFQSELGSAHDTIPKYSIVIPNIGDHNIISRVFRAVKTCITQCSLLSQTDWVVPKILLALKMEENLLLGEKVCVFFTLLLLNLSTAAPRIFGKSLNRDFILCLDSFSRHIHEVVMSDVETKSILADFLFLDGLLRLIEDFLIDGRVMVYNKLSSEGFIKCDSRIDFLLDGVNVMLFHEVASADQLVASSIILASICAAIDQIGFIYEASYNIFRRHACDSSLVLTILHVFAYLCGQKFFGLTKCDLLVTVFKSIVMLLEGINLSVSAACCPPSVSEVYVQFHPSGKCPFAEGAVSVDMVTSLLLEVLQNNAVLETTNYDMVKSVTFLNSRVLFDDFKSEVHSCREGGYCASDMNSDASCCLDKYDAPTSRSDSAVYTSLCLVSDVLSLLELVACNMKWDWTSIKMVPQLLKILESCVLENFAAAIVVLLGQIGSIGVDAGGYEDKGVESLRGNLSAFLSRESTMKAGLPLQVATITALLELLPLDFDTLIQSNGEIPATSTESVHAYYVRKWFSLLSKGQQDLSVRLLHAACAKKK